MADLAVAIIDRSYGSMKNDFLPGYHDYCEWKPFTAPLHLPYAAKDAYVSYEMYWRILTMKDGLHHHRYLNNGVGVRPVLREGLRVRFTMNE
jgi:hypothetical protein